MSPDLGGLISHVSGVEQIRSISTISLPDVVTPRVRAGSVSHPGTGPLHRRRAGLVYGRLGTSTVRFGTVTSWLVDVVNVLTGNLDRPGGAMFASSPRRPSHAPARPGRGFSTSALAGQVSGHPETTSEMRRPCWPKRSKLPARVGSGVDRGGGNPVL